VPVYCGEFGVYDLNSNPDDRVFWYEIVRKYLEEKNIAWTIWDYQGAFGLFEKNSIGFFKHDLNIPILEALGLTVPDQTPYIQAPDSVGFMIYTDYFGPNIKNASYGTGIQNFFSEQPVKGDFCFSWEGALRYESIVFDFFPNKDLSFLEQNNYALSILVKGNDPNGNFDIRFIDSKTNDPNDHPWRIRKILSNNQVQWDNQWHKLYFPLSGFTEHGSWDIDTWYNPEGKFDWTAIDKLEIVTEARPMGNFSLWLDDIAITNLDTATIIVPNGINEFYQPGTSDFATIRYSPSTRKITIQSSFEESIQYWLVDLTGRNWNSGSFRNEISIETGCLSDRVFLIYLETRNSGQMVRKLVLN
jgi:endoglucanase